MQKNFSLGKASTAFESERESRMSTSIKQNKTPDRYNGYATNTGYARKNWGMQRG